jgi:hypothetical protein
MPSLDVNWGDLDWAASAFRIFRIDRTNVERSQVDLVGGCLARRRFASLVATPTYPVTGSEVSVQPYIRNGSELPVEVRMFAYEIHTKWLVPREDGAYEPVDGPRL